ncbi:hypothetical protein VFPPC_14281 [Pochonia chlamydosporia 170]|uniref:Uncharacterized protein n=1 Tax=Pochonia chlamydosporia 170 TaxID=1380566 RepID=A0A179FLZ3_METCM|nr:hypothetical protein VFPPC_14281 [Pochonia chlamydosporia 170]OAQ66063.1 hypothetical protein VFPPC_14281 [Pochonia chlamydosporia 170]
MSQPFSLQFVGSGGGHDDIQVRIGEEKHVVDSYYFMLDSSPNAPKTEDKGVKMLLKQWLDLLQPLEKGREGYQVYLPYGFFDQCTAWMQVTLGEAPERGDRAVEVQGGWGTPEGWSFMPSHIATTSNNMNEGKFEAIPDLKVTTTLASLRSSIDSTQRKF